MKKKYCFDLDGVICKTIKNFYSRSVPLKDNIKTINNLYSNGHKIIIFTARYMGRSNERVSIAKSKGFEMTKKQLNQWGVKYHKLIFGKPSFDVLVDDKAFNHDFDWYKKIIKKNNSL